MQTNTRKIVKSIALIASVILSIIAISFGIAQYEKYKNQGTVLHFYEYRINANEGEITVSPTTYTGEEVTVTISPKVLETANKGKTDKKDMLKIQYQLGNENDIREDGWIDYTGPFKITENTEVHTRLFSEQKM